MGETRREFLKKGSLGLAGFFVTQAVKANIANTQKVQATTQAAPVTAEQKTEAEVQSEPQAPVQIQKEPEPIPQKEKGEEEIKETREISLLFSNTTPLEKSKAWEMIEKQIAHYKSEPQYKKRINDTLRFKNIVFESAKNLGFRENSPVPKLLLSLIYVESGGDPDASPSKDKDAAKGLCQIKPSTVLPIARRLRMNPNLFDPWTNITLTLEHFDRLFKLFPDPSLAFWTYHLGEGNMVEAIEEYVVTENGEDRKKVQSTLNFIDDKGERGSASLIRKHNLNFIKLINSKNVVAKLKELNAFGNETNLYVPRVGAATFLLNE